MSEATPAPATTPAKPPVLELVALGLLVIGAFGPWASLFGISKSGIDGDGVITLALAAIVGVILILNRVRGSKVPLAVLFVAGALALAIAIIDILDIRDKDVDVGWGLWLTLLGSIVLLAAAVRRLMDRGDR
jgi:4-amino-4-deoxy-L-arabinose transferase-like glycosyltransferase